MTFRPLSEREVRALLAVAMGYDNRKPGDANILAWMTAAEIGRWTFDSAREAIHQHYAHSRDFLMPADITARVKAMREDEVLRANAALPPADDPEAAKRHRSIVDRIFGMPSQQAQESAKALSVACSWCHAPKGQPCTNGKRARRSPHPSRIDAAKSAA